MSWPNLFFNSPSAPHTCNNTPHGYIHQNFPCICAMDTSMLTTLKGLLMSALGLTEEPWPTIDMLRYGVGRDAITPFPISDPTASLADKLLGFNQYLLDGYVHQNLPYGFQKSIQPTWGSYFKVNQVQDPSLEEPANGILKRHHPQKKILCWRCAGPRFICVWNSSPLMETIVPQHSPCMRHLPSMASQLHTIR